MYIYIEKERENVSNSPSNFIRFSWYIFAYYFILTNWFGIYKHVYVSKDIRSKIVKTNNLKWAKVEFFKIWGQNEKLRKIGATSRKELALKLVKILQISHQSLNLSLSLLSFAQNTPCVPQALSLSFFFFPELLSLTLPLSCLDISKMMTSGHREGIGAG